MLKPLALLLIVLSGCAHQGNTDFAGNPYPAECQADMPVRAKVVLLPPADMETMRRTVAAAGGEQRRGRLMGLWLPSGTIYLDSTMVGAQREDAQRHEACHDRYNELYPETKGQWHP